MGDNTTIGRISPIPVAGGDLKRAVPAWPVNEKGQVKATVTIAGVPGQLVNILWEPERIGAAVSSGMTVARKQVRFGTIIEIRRDDPNTIFLNEFRYEDGVLVQDSHRTISPRFEGASNREHLQQLKDLESRVRDMKKVARENPGRIDANTVRTIDKILIYLNNLRRYLHPKLEAPQLN